MPQRIALSLLGALCIVLLFFIPLKLSQLHKTLKQAVVLQKSSIAPSVTTSEFPPMYPGISWGKQNTGGYSLKTGYIQTPSSLDISKLGQNTKEYYYNISGIFKYDKLSLVINYYDLWFKQNGWQEDVDAGGPLGDVYGYLKNGKRFLLTTNYIPENGFDYYQVIVEHN